MSRVHKILDPLLKSSFWSHVGFWVIMVLILAYHGSLFGGNFQDNLINMCVLLPSQMAAAYLLIYVQLPRLLYKRHWIAFLLSFLVGAYLLSVLARLSVIHISEPIIGIDGIDESLWEILTDPIYLFKVYVISVYLPSVVLFLLKMTKERFTQETRLITLENEKRSAELNFLKAQMNPHFLFNTLNNLYGLAKAKSDQTPEMILKLSEILDYTIYEGKAKRVPLIKEWQLIENYTDLQALRQSEQSTVAIHQQMDDPTARIAPLILISLVENAFKHSLKRKQDGPNIKIDLHLQAGVLRFKIFNTKSDKRLIENINKKGIGVQNVKRQLELQYPKRHDLIIAEQANTYEVTLTIHL